MTETLVERIEIELERDSARRDPIERIGQFKALLREALAALLDRDKAIMQLVGERTMTERNARWVVMGRDEEVRRWHRLAESYADRGRVLRATAFSTTPDSAARYIVEKQAEEAEELSMFLSRGLALLRAPETPERGWQDISTAPKDGTRILVWGSEVGYDDPVQAWIAEWSTSAWHGPAWVGTENRSDTEYLEPTHWMPLPSPPAQTEDSQ